MAKNFFSDWKKFSTNGKNTVMAHPNGHKMVLQHKHLTPEHLEQLHALPFAGGGEVADKPLSKGFKKEHPGIAYDVETPSKDWKEADRPQDAASRKPAADAPAAPAEPEYDPYADKKLTRQGYADGGKVKKDTVPEPNKKAAADMQKGALSGGTSASQAWGNLKNGLGFADGGEVPSEEEAVDLSQMASAGSPGDFNNAAVSEAAPMPFADDAPAPEVAPEVQEVRNVYNSMAMPAIDAKGGVPDADAANDKRFGPKGEAPAQFDASLWKEAQAKHAESKVAQTAQAAQKGIATNEENAARQSAGLAPLPGGMASQAAAQDPGLQAQASQAVTGAQQQVNDSMDPTKIMERGIMQQKAGMAQEAQATAKLGQQQDQMLQQQVNLQQEATKQYQTHYQDLENERQALIKDINESKIDPKHYMDSMGTASKIATAIGLIAGGIGAGLTHTNNDALAFLNSQIDRDINAQKASLGKKENLLSANMRQFGNLNQATEMTRVMQTDIISNQLKQAAAKAQGPLAKARLMQAAGALDQQSAPAIAKMAGRQTLNAMVKQYGSDPKHAQDIITAAQNVDPEIAKDFQSRYIPGMGFANTADDAKTLKEMSADANGARSSIQRLKAINAVNGKSLSPALRTEAQSIAAGLVGQLNRPFTGGGPMSDGERKLIESIARNPTALLSLDSSNKKALDTLEGMLNVKMSEAAKARGLQSSGVKEFNHRPVK